MPKSSIIVVGASAGGVEALQVLVHGLPPDLDAAVFVVLHIGEGTNRESVLPDVLTRAGPVPAKHPSDGEAIRQGTIYVAPPDCHILLSRGQVHLSRGPKENRTRPAINPLFRSAARSYRSRVAGVILSGLLDDGVAGLAEIKRCGGTAIVQDPATAMFASMPINAIRRVPVDHVLPLGKIAGVIANLSTTEYPAMEKEEPLQRELIEITCPSCHGPIWQERQGDIVEFRCLIGHAFSPLAMAAEHREAVERALWNSVLALEQAAEIDEKLAADLGPQSAEDAERKRRDAAAIRGIIDQYPSQQA